MAEIKKYIRLVKDNGDVILTNLVDSNTGESVEYIKVPDPTGIVPDGVIYRQLVTTNYGTELFVDAEFKTSGVIKAEKFGFVWDGVTDNLPQFTKLIQVHNNVGGRILFPSDKTWYLSDNIHTHKSINIDFNNNRILAYRGLFDVDSSGAVAYTNGNYFTTVKGSMSFSHISGVTDNIQVGDILIIRSNTPYIVDGDYRHGQIINVKSIDSSRIHMHDAFYESYQVDTIHVYKGETCYIKNGIVDMSACPGANKGLQLTGYKTIDIRDMIFIGSDPAGCAMEPLADRVYIENCQSSGFKNTTGIGTGRLGYGFNVTANYASINGCKGDRCKHLFSNGNRNVTSLYIEVNGFQGYNPPNDFDLGVPEATNGGPMYQHMIDFHANCLQAVVNNPVLEGCNGMIAVRNGWAIINNPVFRSRAVQAGFNNRYLIIAYEHQIENIIINNPTLYVDPPLTNSRGITQTEVAVLFGIQQTSLHVDHKDVRIINPNFYGGYIATIRSGSLIERSGTVNLKLLSVIGARGWVNGGIEIQGIDADRWLGTIDTVEMIDCQLLQSIDNGASRKILTVSNTTRLNNIKIKDCSLDWRNYLGIDGIISLAFLANQFTPTKINISGNELHASKTGVTFTSNQFSSNWGDAIIKNNKLYYNYSNTQNFSPGFYMSTQGNQASPDIGVWDFTNSKVISMNPNSVISTQQEGIRSTQLAKYIIDFLEVNTNISIADSSYLTSEYSIRRLPYGAVNRGSLGYLPFLGKRLRPDGKLYIPNANQSNPSTSSAIPTITPVYDGEYVYNDNYNGIAPYGWVAYNNTWYKLLAT